MPRDTAVAIALHRFDRADMVEGIFRLRPLLFRQPQLSVDQLHQSRPTGPTSEVREVAAITLMAMATRHMLTEACANQTHDYT